LLVTGINITVVLALQPGSVRGAPLHSGQRRARGELQYHDVRRSPVLLLLPNITPDNAGQELDFSNCLYDVATTFLRFVAFAVRNILQNLTFTFCAFYVL
jgi:hypothetical protein